MDLGIEGRVALVTASSAGLGRASAEALAGEGAKVVLCARGRDRLEAAVAEIRARGGDAVGVPGDVSRPEVPAQLVASALESFGRLDIVVANAGGPPAGRALDVDDEAVRAAVETNALSAIRLVREALPVLRAGRWGRICCISSYSVVRPLPNLALSNLARTGLLAWARTAATDLAAEGSGITLNLACPGPHRTDRMVELGGGESPMGEPADFGRVVAFLCSAPAGFVNGAAVVVDGGQSA